MTGGLDPGPVDPGGAAAPVRRRIQITDYTYVRHVIIKAEEEGVNLTDSNPFLISEHVQKIIGYKPAPPPAKSRNQHQKCIGSSRLM